MQCSYIKIQQLDHQTIYGQNREFAQKCRMIPCLAFVPLEDVEMAFEALALEFDSDINLVELISYFELNYIGRRRLGSEERHAPRFSKQLWNHFQTVRDNNARTNNNVEGWNFAFANLSHCSHPHIFKLIEFLKQDMDTMRCRIIQAETGQSPPLQRPEYRRVNERLASIVDSYNGGNVIQYLRSISSIVQFN